MPCLEDNYPYLYVIFLCFCFFIALCYFYACNFLYHGPSVEKSSNSKPTAFLLRGLTGPSVQVSETVASLGALFSSEELLIQDEQKKERRQAKV